MFYFVLLSALFLPLFRDSFITLPMLALSLAQASLELAICLPQVLK